MILTTRSAVVERSIVVSVFVAILACQLQGQAELRASHDQGQAAQTLQRYIQFRLLDAEWKEYSQLVTWPDEPSWDCRWVASKYLLGASVKKTESLVIPVVYKRLGLFCYDFDFKLSPRVVTINYELVRHPSGWKVNAPIPDYPDISGDTLVKSLDASAGNVNETPERRAQAVATARRIARALKHGAATSRKQARTHRFHAVLESDLHAEPGPIH